MFPVTSGFKNSGFKNNAGCSTDLPDASAAGTNHCEIPSSVASDTPAFSDIGKCQIIRPVTTFTPGSTNHDLAATQLTTRNCTEPQMAVAPPTMPNRELLGGKGMFLTLMQSAELAVPPFRCIETGIVQELEALQFDASPLLTTLDDGHEFAHATASLGDIRQWIVKMEPAGNPSGNPTARQKRWLDALSSFIAGPDFYQQISALPIA
ncbi:hypothetical protein, partial [Endozoicomonas sp. ONNA2]|uniref:hypothetical protein n=1 Tax=Endozoicomonas sp. ONNA2 TaxID=2828741 RepID=UPI002147614E